MGEPDLAALIERFHTAHAREYGYALRDRPVELITARMQAIGDVPKAPQGKIAGGASLAGAVIGRRRMYIDAARGWRETPVYQRERLPVGIDIPGPAAINEMSATTLFFPDQTARIDPWGNLIVGVAS